MQLRKLTTEEKGIKISFVKCPRVFNFLIDTQFCHYGEDIGENPIFDKYTEDKKEIMKKGCSFFEIEYDNCVICNKKPFTPYANKPKIENRVEAKEKVFNHLNANLNIERASPENGNNLENIVNTNANIERASPEAFTKVIEEQKNNFKMDALDKKIAEIKNNMNKKEQHEVGFNKQSRKIVKNKTDSIEAFTKLTRKAPKNKV